LPSDLSVVGTEFIHGDDYSELLDALNLLTVTASKHPYHQYHFLWTHALQNCLFVRLFAVWQIEKSLVNPEELAAALGTVFEDDQTDEMEFRVTADEFLHSVISLVNELSRLAVNSVTTVASKGSQEPFTLPVDIDRFIKEIQAGFGALNLKNDSLRRRYDGMKYDVKKVEEVVYDLSLRGFLTETI
jgi:hypothetical protein